MQPRQQRQWDRVRAYREADNFNAAATVLESILKDDTQDARAWSALASVELQRARLREAIEAARQASDRVMAHGQWSLLTHVAMQLVMLGDYRQMVDLILAAPPADPAIRRHAAGLAQYLGLADQHQAALKLIESAMCDAADDSALAYAHGNCLRYCGKMGAATVAYERCIALASGHAEAHWSLAYHQRSDPPGARLPRLRKLAGAVSADSPAAPYIHYALFKEYDDADDPRGAWRALRMGMLRKHKRVSYNTAAETMRYRTLMRLCDAGFLATPVSGDHTGHTPIFIVGLPRSGTTLLERVLGHHSAVQSVGEIGDLHMQLCWEARTVATELPDMQILDRHANIDFASLGAGYLERTAWRANNKPFIVDKFPANFIYAGFIRKALPQAKIICLRRDPMDVCFSNLKELFSARSNPHSYALGEMAAHHGNFRMLLAHWQQAMPDAIHCVDYEELVRNPESTVRGVASFCGLPYEPQMLDILGNTTPSATASASQVREPIHARNIGAWKRYATPLEPMRALLASAEN